MPTNDNILLTSNIVKSKNKTYNLFIQHIAQDFTTIVATTPHEYVQTCWDRYKTNCPQFNNSLNGNIFETIIATCLYRENILPMFLQAKVAFVPNVDFDIILYTQEQYPIALSLKTSVRERYKQADLEGVALKYVHRKARNYLLMLDSDETRNLKAKKDNGELLGLDEIISANTNEFDLLISTLQNKVYINPGVIDIITGNMVK